MPNLRQWPGAVRSWPIPDDWICVETIDAHTAGEPLRIFVDGFPEPAGDTVLQRRQDAAQRLEFYRTGTMWEPRGHADMYGCLIIPPERASSDFGVLFLHNEGYSSMCGHGIIAVATVAVQVGWISNMSATIPLAIDAPAGLIQANVRRQAGVVDEVSFENVPSFAVALQQQVNVPDLGVVTYDLAFGGAYYAFVDADELGLDLIPQNQSQLVDFGRRIKQAVASATNITHPTHDDLSFLYGTIFTGKPQGTRNHSRHVCVFADGEVDRSPTGTGVSARAAILHAREQLLPDTRITIESILGTCFDVELVGATTCGAQSAVRVKVHGKASITGRQQFLFDPRDELRGGFFLR